MLPDVVVLWEDDYNRIKLTDRFEHRSDVFPLPEEFEH